MFAESCARAVGTKNGLVAAARGAKLAETTAQSHGFARRFRSVTRTCLGTQSRNGVYK